MTLYRDIFKQALNSAWRFKYLWFFGLFAVFLGNVGEFELIIRGFGNSDYPLIPGLDGIMESGLLGWQGAKGMFAAVQSEPLSFFIAVGILLGVLAIGLFLFWLAVCSQAALVHSAACLRNKKSTSLKSSLTVGMAKFWPVMGLNAIMRLAMYSLFILLGLPIALFSAKLGSLGLSLLYVLAFIIFAVAAAVASFIVKYAIAFTVIKDSPFLAAVKKSWQLFAHNWLISLEMAFILFFINFLAGTGVVLALLIVSIPFLFMAYMFAVSGLLFSFWLIISLALVFYVSVIALAGAFLSVFQISSWTGLFLELASRGGVSKLVRIFSKE